MLDREKKGPAIKMVQEALNLNDRMPVAEMRLALDALGEYLNSRAELNEVQARAVAAHLVEERASGRFMFFEYHRFLISVATYINSCR